MNRTRLLYNCYFSRRLKALEDYTSKPGEVQAMVLRRLLDMAQNTEWGKKYSYATIKDYDEFRRRLPIQTYEEVKPFVERIRRGEQNLLPFTPMTHNERYMRPWLRSDYADSLALPLARRRARTLRPLAVAILLRKP